MVKACIFGQVDPSTHFSGNRQPTVLLLHNNPPADSGHYLIQNAEGLHPLVTEGGPPMMKPNSGVADKAIDRILELSGDAHLQRRGTVGDSMKPKSVSDSYRILRVHHRFSWIQSIRFALWLHAGEAVGPTSTNRHEIALRLGDRTGGNADRDLCG